MAQRRNGTGGQADSENHDDSAIGTGLRRSAKLFGLPLGAAARASRGLGQRIQGVNQATVSQTMRNESAEQLFRVLGEMKGGAQKLGQVLSMFETVLPDDIAGPYRVQLERLQDSAPPMPTSRVHSVLARELGPEWRKLFTDFSARPAAAASIGQVHRARWAATGEPVAVKVQYPGAEQALAQDMRQLSRLSSLIAPLAGGIDVKPLMTELAARINEEADYDHESAAQQQAAEGFSGHREFVVPTVLRHTGKVMISEWIEGANLRSTVELDQAERNEVGLRYVRFLFAGPSICGLLHADPHPGNFKVLPDGRLGAIDFGLVERLPHGLPETMGRLIKIAASGDGPAVVDGLAAEGFIAGDPGRVDPDELLAYLSPFVEPALVPEFNFDRDWMRSTFQRVGDAKLHGRVVRQLNLPPDYLLIHRVWLGGIAVLSQLGVQADFRSVLEEYLPGWVSPLD